MGKLIFIDVGGHRGQSVEVALNPAWRFDHVHTFEPDPQFAEHIETRFADAVRDGRLTVHQTALGRRDEDLLLYGDNAKGGATVVAQALAAAGSPRSVRCVDVNAFVASLGTDVRLYMKLNCEGAEVAILDRLCEATDIAPFAAIVADFDVVKTGFGYFEKRRVIARCKARGLPVVLSEAVMVGKSHAARLSNWLSHHAEIASPGLAPTPRAQLVKRRVRYFIRDLRSAIGLNAAGYLRKG